jgi:Amt family ammonium transporter
VLPGWSILFGVIGVLVVYYSIKLKPYIKVDDSLDVFFSHGLGGVAGALLTGLFSSKSINPLGTVFI